MDQPEWAEEAPTTLSEYDRAVLQAMIRAEVRAIMHEEFRALLDAHMHHILERVLNDPRFDKEMNAVVADYEHENVT